MSNSTYCDDQYEQPWWSKKIERLERRIRDLEKERDEGRRLVLDEVCRWLDGNACRYIVNRPVNGFRMTGIDVRMTDDLRKAMEE